MIRWEVIEAAEMDMLIYGNSAMSVCETGGKWQVWQEADDSRLSDISNPKSVLLCPLFCAKVSQSTIESHVSRNTQICSSGDVPPCVCQRLLIIAGQYDFDIDGMQHTIRL